MGLPSKQCDNTVLVYNKLNASQRIFTLKSTFFKPEDIGYKIIEKPDYFKIVRASISDRNYIAANPKAKSPQWYQLSAKSTIPAGRYEADEEESNEDQLVYYYNK